MSEEITKDFEKIAPKRWKRYPLYKDSGVEWIGEIPVHWAATTLRRISKLIQTGNTPPTSKKEFYEDGSIPWYGPESFSENILLTKPKKLISVKAYKSGFLRIFDSGVVLVVSIGASIGKIGLLMNKGSCNQQINVVQFADNVDSKWGAYFLVFASDFISSTAPRNTLPIFDQSRLASLKALHLPINEQKEISSFLDQKLSEMERLSKEKKRLIELLKEKRTAIISQAVTKGLDPNAPMKDSGVEWIGEIPEGWDVAKLKRVVNHVGRGISPKYAEKSSIAVINQACIYWEGISEDDLKYHEETDISELRKGLLKKGDLLLNSTGTGTLGRALLFNLDRMCIADSHVTIVRCNRKLMIPSFLKLLVETPLYQSKILNELVGGSTNQIELSREKLRNLIIVLPHIEEQERIVAYATERNHKLDSFISKIEKSIELLKEYRSALITAAVTGKIDVREEVP